MGGESATLATRVEDKILACPVPPLGGPGVEYVDLRISIYEGERGKNPSAFRIRIADRCPIGQACVDGEIIECAPGHECPGGFIYQPPRRCPIGTYQDSPGAATCIPCPRGFICPFAAMETPLPCPPGFNCDSQGLSSPPKECPAGLYCLAGT